MEQKFQDAMHKLKEITTAALKGNSGDFFYHVKVMVILCSRYAPVMSRNDQQILK